MSFVPVFVPPPQPTHRTRELADRITTIIQRYEQEHPKVSSDEIRQAAYMAVERTRGRGKVTAMATVLLGAAILGALAGVAFLWAGGSQGLGEVRIVLVIGALAVFGILAVVAKRGGLP